MPPRTSRVEQRALRLIYDAGDEGLLQSELWKLLDVSSREGSRLAKKFEEKDRIVREKVLNNGRWTYKLFSKNEPVTLESVRGCPCLICSEVEKCFRGGTKDPVYCLLLTAWIDPRIEIMSDSDH
ncbi:transcriptional regulator [Candidatus Bathyarchaeota archaeon]|nr:transcriptional regulator [Candidatus Bathyarchaeota archaeon]MCK4702043.1 transcriptional regulator [Candidatus Bathyarchaeota archaeon]